MQQFLLGGGVYPAQPLCGFTSRGLTSVCVTWCKSLLCHLHDGPAAILDHTEKIVVLVLIIIIAIIITIIINDNNNSFIICIT